MKSFHFCLVALFFSSIPISEACAEEPERLGYGSRAGMDVIIVGKSGINTSKAVIKIKLTLENAAEFCELYLNDTSKSCAKKILRADGAKLWPAVTGNCRAKTWTDMYGNSYVFKGRNLNTSGNVMAEFLIENRKTGEVLDGSSASGYGVAIGVFEALCPRTSKSSNVYPAKIKKNDDGLEGISEDAKGKSVETRIGKAHSEERAVSERQTVAVNRVHKEDALASSEDYPTPKPPPKPIEVLMAAAVNMIIRPSNASPPDRSLSSGIAINSNSTLGSATSGPSERIAENNDQKGLYSKHPEAALNLKKTTLSPQSKDESRVVGGAVAADPNSRVIRDDEVVIERGGKGSLLSTHKRQGSRKVINVGAFDALPLPGYADGNSSHAESKSIEERISALESEIASAPSSPFPDRVVCKSALSRDGSQWEGEPEFRGMVDEALNRGMTIKTCQDELGLSNPSKLRTVPGIQQADIDKLNAELKKRSGQKRKIPLETGYYDGDTDGSSTTPLHPSPADSEKSPPSVTQQDSSEDKLEFDLGCLSYSGQADACVRIIKKVGLGTRKAVIKVKPTLDDAIRGCAEVNTPETPKEENIRCGQEKHAWEKRLKSSVYADCKKRTWTDLYGNSFRLLRKSKKAAEFSERYDVIKISTGKKVIAMPYYTVTSIFSRLCPAIAPKDW